METKLPGELFARMGNKVCYSGTTSSSGTILSHGPTGGLPDVVDLIQIVAVNRKVGFIVKCVYSWKVGP